MQIAYFTPLPPQKSGIAIYNAQLLPHLAQLANITLFTDQPDKTDASLQSRFEIRSIQSFKGPLAEGSDICLYQMGNNIQYHEQIFKALRRFPGVVTLHDLNLHSFFGEYLLKRSFAGYTKEMGFAYGQAGLNHARRTHFEQSKYDVERFPLFDRIAKISLGLIVHSRYARHTINQRHPQQAVAHINLHQRPLTDQLPSQADAKAQLGYQADETVLASFGYISPDKRIESVLQAVAKLQKQPAFNSLRYALVGQIVDGYNIQSLLTQLGIENIVRLVGYVDDDLFNNYLAATDIGVNLRHPTRGETSSTLLTLMAAAKPALVSNVDAFAELPADTCLKIEPGANEQIQIEEALTRLFASKTLRQEMGQQALRYINQECNPQTVAQSYITFIEQILSVR